MDGLPRGAWRLSVRLTREVDVLPRGFRRLVKISSRTAVIAKETAQTFAANDAASRFFGDRGREEKHIFFALMISLAVIVSDMFVEGST